MSFSGLFSPDYATARERFRKAAAGLGWQLESYPIGFNGPNREELTIDVRYPPDTPPSKVLVISSGVHGVEGFSGRRCNSHYSNCGLPQGHHR